MVIEIVDLPIKNGGSFHNYVTVYRRVNLHFPMVFPFSYGFSYGNDVEIWWNDKKSFPAMIHLRATLRPAPGSVKWHRPPHGQMHRRLVFRQNLPRVSEKIMAQWSMAISGA